MWEPLGLGLLGNCDPPDHTGRTANVVNHGPSLQRPELPSGCQYFSVRVNF